MRGDFSGRTVFVTGGTSGIGLAIAHGLGKAIIHECSSRDFNGHNSKRDDVQRAYGSHVVLPEIT